MDINSPPNLPVIRCIQNCIWLSAYSKWDRLSNVLVYSNRKWTYHLELINGLQYEVTRYNNRDIYRKRINHSAVGVGGSSLLLKEQ